MTHIANTDREDYIFEKSDGEKLRITVNDAKKILDAKKRKVSIVEIHGESHELKGKDKIYYSPQRS